jgi:hypothetical protein
MRSRPAMSVKSCVPLLMAGWRLLRPLFERNPLDPLTVFYDMAKPVEVPQIGPARQVRRFRSGSKCVLKAGDSVQLCGGRLRCVDFPGQSALAWRLPRTEPLSQRGPAFRHGTCATGFARRSSPARRRYRLLPLLSRRLSRPLHRTASTSRKPWPRVGSKSSPVKNAETLGFWAFRGHLKYSIFVDCAVERAAIFAN